MVIIKHHSDTITLMISAVVLAHNNERTIDRTLAGLDWCDEVIVVDDYSSDETVKVAESNGAQVVKRHLDNDFAAQRNFGLEQTKGGWVLFIDSDEIVTDALKKEIRTKIQTTDCNGFYVKRRDILFGSTLQHGETARVALLRLAKKETGRWVRPVHEIWNVSGKIDTLLQPLEHYPHPTMTEFIADINYYSTVNAELMHREGKRVSWLHIVSFPLGKFFQNYVVFMGFKDGMPGAIMAFMMSFHSFLTRGKLYALNQKNV